MREREREKKKKKNKREKKEKKERDRERIIHIVREIGELSSKREAGRHWH